MTIAISLLIHGEAVRFNRGQSRRDDYDFKYMRGRDGREYPYVSSQCFKRYWRESLPGPYSPVIRGKDTAGKAANHAFTFGDPMVYVDDDLFGYMIAGATETENDSDDMAGTEPIEDAGRVFEAENLKESDGLKTKLLDGSPLSNFILESVPEAAESLRSPASPDDLREALLNLLDETARKHDLFKVEGVNTPKKTAARFKKPIEAEELRKINRDLLLKTFSKELRELQEPKRDTTRRTAPVRMHALVAFSGIKTAKDLQTFSRNIVYTGENSILNPNHPGIYSGWLKTRILIETHRIGKFYIGKNMDILKDQVDGHKVLTELNPYSREQRFVEYVQLDDAERTMRLRAVLKALADIGNRQGPASGALHDGSLRPKAFIAGIMNCADSPFDYIWTGRNDDDLPYLDVKLLRESIRDWEDLFAAKKIYIGLPAEAGRHSWSKGPVGESPAVSQSPFTDVKNTIQAELREIGFEAVVDTPRKALLRLAEEAAV